MDSSITRRMQALPPALREPLETVAMLVQDLAVQVVEGTASLPELEDARELFRQILDAAVAYLRDEAERELFALPRRTRPSLPTAH